MKIEHIKNPEPGVMKINGKLITYKGLAPTYDSEMELNQHEIKAVRDFLIDRHLNEMRKTFPHCCLD
jgi:hypothetical protein